MAKWSKTAEQLAAKEQVIVLAVFAQINVAACKLPSLIKHCSVELSDPVEENPVYWIIHSHPSQMHFSGRRFSLTHRSYYFQPNYGIINILYYVSVFLINDFSGWIQPFTARGRGQWKIVFWLNSERKCYFSHNVEPKNACPAQCTPSIHLLASQLN